MPFIDTPFLKNAVTKMNWPLNKQTEEQFTQQNAIKEVWLNTNVITHLRTSVCVSEVAKIHSDNKKKYI